MSKLDKWLPQWLISLVDYSSKNGEWAVDVYCKLFLVVLLILCHSLIIQFVWWITKLVWSLVWFFCPLRLFVGGGGREVIENGAKKATHATRLATIKEEVESPKRKDNGAKRKTKVY